MEKTFKGPLVHPPCNVQEHLPLDEVAQSPVYADIEGFQVWSIQPCCGQPVAAILSLVGITGQKSPTVNLFVTKLVAFIAAEDLQQP